VISHKYKCIFIHIPKCAGTSIEIALGHHNSIGRIEQDHRSIRMIEKPLLTPHIFSSGENAIEILRRIHYKFRIHTNPCNKFTVTKEQYANYFKFAFIRNPWSRAYSWYKNVMRDENHQRFLKITRPLSLNEFLRLYKGKGALRSQTCWIKNFSGLIPLDYIGRFENLDEDFEEACKRMDIGPFTLPHETKGTTTDYREEYDKESINIISESNKEEIELFSYSFES
jgi:hypothetical protein